MLAAATPVFSSNMNGETLPCLKKIVILSTGQSNMPSYVPFEWTPAPNLATWNFEASTQPSTDVGTGWNTPDGHGVGPALAFASEFALADPLSMVYVINIYRGGLGISNWSSAPPSYNFRQAIMANVQAALADIGVSEIDYFIFGGCESDTNSESQTIKSDVNQMLFAWLDTQPWFTQKTMSFIRGMSPWAATAPGNGDYRWRRYSRALKAVAASDPARRAFIDIESLPISLFDPTGVLPYIHMTAAGYYASGVRMGRQILGGVHTLSPKYEQPTYSVGFVNAVNCAVSPKSATWKRESDDLVSLKLQIPITAATAGTCSFDFTIPIKTFAQPGNVSGVFASANGDSGIIMQSPNKDFLRAVFVAKYAGAVLASIDCSFTCAPSDG